MYYLALIQNESEMMRYSWADIRPSIQNMNYGYDSFTAENLESFFVGLDKQKYDAIVIAANACNDNNVLTKLEKNREKISKYLLNGGGLFISFQMRLANQKSYGFLPPEFDVRCINRISMNENPKEGTISINGDNTKHTVLFHPNEISVKAIKYQCLHNDKVEGLYWTYLESIEEDKYDAILEDSSSDFRKLLLVSRETEKPRIVVSSISLDWQMHSNLLANVLDYVAKGRPITAIIKKSGIDNFEFKYLVSNYESRRLSYTIYSVDQLAINKTKSHIHDVFILDPSWSKKEINKFVKDNKNEILNGKHKIIVFDNKRVLPTYSVIANFKSYRGVISSVLVWLQSIYDTEKPYWQGSFWRTYDVLFAFKYFDVPVTIFKDGIVRELDKHDKNGSYDEVLGATCAMYQIYKWLYGDERNARIARTEQWIIDNMDSKTLFEKATAIEILVRNGVNLSDTIINDAKEAIMQRVSKTDNEFTIYRYCKSLYACGFLTEAIQVAQKFAVMQEPKEGKWVNLSNTAAILDLLLDVYASIDNGYRGVIEQMILAGVSYIKTHYDENTGSWQGDASCSAKCIVVLEKFETLISLPIDLALTDTEHSLKWVSVSKMLKTAMENNRNYIENINRLSLLEIQQTSEVIQLKKARDSARKVNLILSGILCMLFVVLALFVVFLNEQKLLESSLNLIKAFVLSNLKEMCLTAATVLLSGYVYYANKNGHLPKWFKFVLSRLKFYETEEKDRG